jgi:hypothetical protein
MKTKLLVLCTAICMACTSASDAQNYSFSQLSSTYSAFSGTVVSIPFWDDFSIIPLHLPFTFKFFNVNKDSIYIIGGFVAFHQEAPGYFPTDNLYYFDTDFQERSIGGPSEISVTTTGSAPNRIYKVQIENAGLVEDMSGTEDDFANCQLWLYETTNVVEIHYGLSNIAAATYSPFTGPTVGLYKDQISFLALSGSAASPTVSTTVASININGTPVTSQVYRFVPTTTGIESVNPSFGNLYPNPSTGLFTMKFTEDMDDVEVSIYNTLGDLVFQQEKSHVNKFENETIDSNMGTGVYLVKVTSREKQFIERIVIQ